MSSHIRRWYKAYLFFLAIAPLQAMAQEGPKISSMSNPVVQVFVCIIFFLALCIILLARVLLGAAQFRFKQTQEEQKKTMEPGLRTGLVIAGLLAGSGAFAEDAPKIQAVTNATIGGMGATTFYVLLMVVIIELILLLGLLYNLSFLLRQEKNRVRAAISNNEEIVVNKWLVFWDKINSFRPAKEESLIDLGHNYDGIRELDNRLPPWWLYGFFACIIFAVIYLWRFEVAHTGPSSLEEYTIAMQKGEEDKENYLRTAASKVDENSVKLLTGEAELAGGKAIFTTVCAACHAADGGGLVGPNLTDQYWLHGGSIKDIFKTIKYGWQEKGMKSWKDDYTPVQIAQLASYVKSLGGTKPLKPKDPQGTLFEENGVKTDSVKPKENSPLISAVK